MANFFTLSKNDNVIRQKRKVRPSDNQSEQRVLLTGFVRLHILHHATEAPVVGHWMMQELGRHGYRLSAGTLYPMLHALERSGYLRAAAKRSGRRAWREYRATPAGRRALQAAKAKLRELFHELIEEGKD